MSFRDAGKWARFFGTAIAVTIGATVFVYVLNPHFGYEARSEDERLNDWLALLEEEGVEERLGMVLEGFDSLPFGAKERAMEHVLGDDFEIRGRDEWVEKLAFLMARREYERSSFFLESLERDKRSTVEGAFVRGMASSDAEWTWDWLNNQGSGNELSWRSNAGQWMFGAMVLSENSLSVAKTISALEDLVRKRELAGLFAQVSSEIGERSILNSISRYEGLDLVIVEELVSSLAGRDLDAAVEWVEQNEHLGTEKSVSLVTSRLVEREGDAAFDRLEKTIDSTEFEELVAREAVSWYGQRDLAKARRWMEVFDSDEKKESASRRALFQMGVENGFSKQALFISEVFADDFVIRRNLLLYSISMFPEEDREEVAAFVKGLSGEDHAMYLEMQRHLAGDKRGRSAL
ncbi:MAG: hypothetical protein AAGB46_02200 [Verrucomicrobiota bacterium]